MRDLEAGIADLRSRIIAERLSNAGVLKYSNELKFAVVNFVSKSGNPTHFAKRVGLSSSTVYLWMTEKEKVKPRRLVVSQDIAFNPIKSTVVQPSTFEAVLANGIVIKGLPLTAECLHILGSTK